MGRRKPRGLKPAPARKNRPVELPQLINRDVELFLQGDPLSQDDCYVGRLTYLTSSWLGFVSAYRSRLFFDHIPLSSVRKVRGIVLFRRKPKTNPFEELDFENPETVMDLIGQEVEVRLQGHQMLEDSAFRTRLDYVKKSWIGVSSIFCNRLLLDHIPVTNIRKVTKVVLIGRYTIDR